MTNQPIPSPITSYKQLRCRVQQHHLNTSSGTLTNAEESLQKELQKELLKTSKLKQMFCQLQNQQPGVQQHTEKHKTHRRHRPRKKTKHSRRRRNYSSSEESKNSSTNSSDDSYSD
ncbi:ORF3 [Torque teno mini virus 9]|uniref:ORF3 n=1 Tax=Torque teno mini virus 9 TaxID=687377 RepID=Q9JG63_9VIRU|nr:ORF3 [Torque teno mini virus 9]BAA93596.1 ORF3 [Torque teno mini virus 9]